MSEIKVTHLKDAIKSSVTGLRSSIEDISNSILSSDNLGLFRPKADDFDLVDDGEDKVLVPKNGESARIYFTRPEKDDLLVLDCNIIYGRDRRYRYLTYLMTVNVSKSGVNRSFRCSNCDLGKLIDEDLRSILHKSGFTEFHDNPVVIVATIFSSSEPDLKPVVEVPSSYDEPNEVWDSENVAKEMSKSYANDMAKFVKSYLSSSFPNFTNVVKIGSFEVSLLTSVIPEEVDFDYNFI